jgi:trimeric autotransporter adhesin
MPNTILGTEFDDNGIFRRKLEGRDRSEFNDGIDFIFGFSGNDILEGKGENDVLDGGTGNDRLDGGTGADTMRGGQGNDTYVVDNSGDLVIEGALAGSGIDLVESSITYTLTQNVENLTLTGIDNNISGFGNNLYNIITGTTGRNILDG